MLTQWVELALVLGMAVVGAWGGWRVGKGRRWLVGFLLPLVVVVLVIAGRRSARMSFVPPVSWAVDATVAPLLMAVVVPVLLMTLAARLKRGRRMVMVLMAAMVGNFSVLPIASPLLARQGLTERRTQMDAEGVCRQTTPYTCGPAAAVTCLWRLGISAEEGELATAAWCGPLIGTDGAVLAEVLSGRVGPAALRAEYRYVEQLDDLKTPAIAAVVRPVMGGHFVAVLAVEAEAVIVGDPLSGVQRLSRGEFLAEWQHTAVIFMREGRTTRQLLQWLRPAVPLRRQDARIVPLCTDLADIRSL